MATVERVLIVGGGVSGLTLGVALARKGIVSEVAEVTPDGNTLGVGISLAPSALRALDTIGLMGECLALGFPYSRRIFCNLAGEVLHTHEFPHLLGPAYPVQLGIPRPALHRLLLDTCRRHGVIVHFGLTAKTLEQGDAGIDVVLSDGERRTYDAVIGADGVYSSVRPMLFGNDGSPSFTGLAAWRIRTPRPPEGECVVLYRGGKHWVGFNPVTNSEGYIFLVEAVANRVHLSQDELMGRLPAMLAGCGGVVARLLPRVTDPASVVYRPIEVVTLRPPWYRGRAILIGDAAHAPAPLVAAGAVIAIEDAVVLAEELVASSTISCAFENFMMRRYKRCGLVVKASLELAAWQKNPRRVQLDPEQVHARIGAELSKPI